ncbi:MAG: U32 family peptidase [Candidatus Delongbacteria bacterium]|nr:U32 family peptidase [Candidatus Delongbacteria bacterium]
MMRKPDKIRLELLSPAKDLQSGMLAVMSGADAVYIGGPGFSARKAAGNSWDDIGKLCSFARQYYAKVYVAINTIFYDGEENQVQDSLNKAYRSGADAVIIQDMGILKLDLPPVDIFASTQCGNEDAGRIRFLRDSGFSRVILARELSLEEIRKIHKEVPDIELEAFVHGALCVSYSGKCYFSQFLSGRSSNRGECMQVCRLTFDLTDEKGNVIAENKYLLSTKDLSMSGHLHDMIDAGVTSFKIEGRLKDAPYIGNVTAKYSQELDRIVAESNGKYCRASSGKVNLSYGPDPDKSFNRGFTQYFYYGRKGSVISDKGQSSLGEFIGKVRNIERNHFTLDRGHDLKNGDGICWTGRNGEVDGVNINSVDGEKISPFKKLPQFIGTDIFRNENPSFEKAVLYGAERRVGAVIDISESEEIFTIIASDEDGNKAELQFPHQGTKAKDASVSEENIRKQMSKTGSTIFSVIKIGIASGQDIFIPVSVINGWRREILKTLLEVRLKNYIRRPRLQRKKTIVSPAVKIDRSYNVSNQLSREYYKSCGAEIVENAYEISERKQIKVLMTSRHCLKHHLGSCSKYGGTAKMSESLCLVLNDRKYILEFDCKKCVMKICVPDNQ